MQKKGLWVPPSEGYDHSRLKSIQELSRKVLTHTYVAAEMRQFTFKLGSLQSFSDKTHGGPLPTCLNNHSFIIEISRIKYFQKGDKQRKKEMEIL